MRPLPAFHRQSMELLDNIDLARRLWQTDEKGLLLEDWKKLCNWLRLELRHCVPLLRDWSPPFIDQWKGGGEKFVSVSIEAGPSWIYKGTPAVSLCFTVFANSFLDDDYRPNVALWVADGWPHHRAFCTFIAEHCPEGFINTCEGSPDLDCPIWKELPFQEFRANGTFDLEGFVLAIREAFEALAAIRPAVDQFLAEQPQMRQAVPRLGKAIILELEGLGEIVEAGLILVAYDAETGEPVGEMDRYEGLRQPQRQAVLPVKFRPKMLAGKELDRAKIEDFLSQADVIIAHNAHAFDRPRFEKLFPSSRSRRWLCALTDLPWPAFGFEDPSLDDLCKLHGIKNRDPHRALSDAEALLHLLAQRRGSVSYFSELLHSEKAQVQGAAAGKRDR